MNTRILSEAHRIYHRFAESSLVLTEIVAIVILEESSNSCIDVVLVIQSPLIHNIHVLLEASMPELLLLCKYSCDFIYKNTKNRLTSEILMLSMDYKGDDICKTLICELSCDHEHLLFERREKSLRLAESDE